jgi:prophage antirepressor-like protein
MIASSDNSFSACRRVAEKEYLLCIQKTSIISEHWFYLFVFRHAERLARIFPGWIKNMDLLLKHSPFISPMHVSQIQSLIILLKEYYNNSKKQ